MTPLLLLLVLCSSIAPTAAVVSCEYDIIPGYSVDGEIIDTLSDVDPEACMEACDALEDCLSFDALPFQKLCRLSSTKDTSPLFFKSPTSINYYEKTNCTDDNVNQTDANVTDVDRCPNGYVDLVGYSCYRFENETQSYYAAHEDCKDDTTDAGTHLMSINSQLEMRFLSWYIEEILDATGLYDLWWVREKKDVNSDDTWIDSTVFDPNNPEMWYYAHPLDSLPYICEYDRNEKSP